MAEGNHLGYSSLLFFFLDSDHQTHICTRKACISNSFFIKVQTFPCLLGLEKERVRNRLGAKRKSENKDVFSKDEGNTGFGV